MSGITASANGVILWFTINRPTAYKSLDGATGYLRWMAPNPYAGPVEPQVVSGDTVFGMDQFGQVTAVNTATGTTLFSVRLDSTRFGSIVGVGSTTVAMSSSSLRLLDRSTGAEIWRLVGNSLTGAPFRRLEFAAVHDTLLIFGVSDTSGVVNPAPIDTFVVGLSMRTGAKLFVWQRSVSAPLAGGAPDPGALTLFQRTNIPAGPCPLFDRKALGVRRNACGWGLFSFPGSGTTVTVPHIPIDFQVQDAATGATLWTLRTGDTTTAVLPCGGGLLRLGSRLRLLDPATGRVLRYRPAEELGGSTVAAGGGRLYVLGDSLWAFACQ
jgi:outer membrane protein assembly factor BamB